MAEYILVGHPMPGITGCMWYCTVAEWLGGILEFTLEQENNE